ncbi:MAG: hypothetical protein R3Y24_13625 [Eubacteriales bacterium]
MNDIVFDKEYTYSYRDKYNEQCDCEQCILYRSLFPNEYKEVATFLSQYGVNIDFPLEILDNGIDDKTLKRNYIAYYAVKGQLPKDKMNMIISDVDITMRNAAVAKESYSNTGMKTPYFVIELSNILLPDNENAFKEAVNIGREIEFGYNGQHFFESRKSSTEWYIYCEETKETQKFSSAQELIDNTILQGCNINNLWEKISLDCIL